MSVLSLAWILLLKLLIIQGFIGTVESKLEVKLLHVLFRHGDKVPHKEFQNYPNDPHRNHSYFPIDSGGLTTKGMQREYKIGRLLREKYGDFFGPYYSPSLIFGRSTDIPRTQMSLQLVLAGLFPPTGQQIWNPHLPWIPVTSVYVPNEQDNLLFPHYCPQYVKEYKRFLEQERPKNIINKYRPTMKYLSEYTGKQVDRTSAVYYLYNLLIEQGAQNLSLPGWTTKVFPNPMKEITALDFNLRSYTTSLKRLNGGILLREITEGIKALRDGLLHPADRKAFFYSAHELNVAAMARTLGTNDPVLPLYGSTIIFETLKDDDDKYYVKIRLWTGVTEKFITQRIPGCSELCPLDNFLFILSDVIATSEEADCYKTTLETSSNGQSSLNQSLSGLLGIIILMIITVIK